MTIVHSIDSMVWGESVLRPDFHNDFESFEVIAGAESHPMNEFGLGIFNNSDGNFILCEKPIRRLMGIAQVNFHGGGNVLALGASCAFNGVINFGRDSTAYIGGRQHVLNMNIDMYTGSSFIWGDGSRTYGCRIWLDGGRRLSVGNDCLFSEGIQIRTSDHHSIIDLDTYEQINIPADVTIGRHVWIGPGVSILKGVDIGMGSIIAAGALVSHSVPQAELWGGVPAKPIKRRVSWVDSHPADAGSIASLRDFFESESR